MIPSEAIKMRQSIRFLALSFLWMACGSCPCLGQQEGGAPRLEDSLEAAPVAPADEAPAAESPPPPGPEPTSARPKGALARPKNGVQHPDLDQAWAEYDAVVSKATQSIRASVTKQFDAAVEKGDLDTAEKWQGALAKLEKDGEIPTTTETKTAVSAAATGFKKGKDELTKAYDVVVKTLTMQKKITEAMAVRNEKRSLESKAADTASAPVKNKRQEVDDEAAKRQQILARFIGVWRTASGTLEEVRADGAYVVNGDLRKEYSGRWTLDFQDPKGPSIVRECNNGRRLRHYVDPTNANILIKEDGSPILQRVR